MKQKRQEVDLTRDVKDSVKDSGQRNGSRDVKNSVKDSGQRNGTEQARESQVTQGVLTLHGWLRGRSRTTRFCPWLPDIADRNRRTCRGK